MSIFTPGLLPLSSRARHGASILAMAVSLAFGPALAASSAQQSDVQVFATGRILVMARAGLQDAALARLLSEQGAGKARRIGNGNLHIVSLPAGASERQLVERLNRHPQIKFAELDRRVGLASAANDPYLGSQWHLAKINAATAWDTSQGAGVKIAIIDTGVDGSHPDLAARMLPGWNFYDNNADTADVYGHGTAVAGTAAATVNNAAGVASVAGQAWIIPVRIAAPDGYAYWSTIAQGLTWAADQGARVANISYAVTASSSVLSSASYMRSKGGLVVVAAGNNGINETTAPSGAVITVSATGSGDTRTAWSSYGAFVTIAAPGEGIWTTTRGGGYAAWNGTSFASPVTAGVVGLMMAANGSLPPADVESLLYATALDLGAAGRDGEFGWGRVNAAAAVQAAAAATSSVDAQAPVATIAAPLASGTVSGLVPVDVSASDNKGVTRVDLKVNGITVASDSSAPFAFSWDSTRVANGMANLVAVAVDAAGNSGSSVTVAVNVANAVVADTAPPVVSISNPLNGAKVSGNVSIKVSASDNLGAAGLRQVLTIDGQQVATASGGALSYNWNTRKVSAGTHAIEAVVTDAAGNRSTRSISVTR